MDGTETLDERNRCQIWDKLAMDGQPKTIEELAKQTKHRTYTVARLIGHEWFKNIGGRIHIAKSPATTKTALVAQ